MRPFVSEVCSNVIVHLAENSLYLIGIGPVMHKTITEWLKLKNNPGGGSGAVERFGGGARAWQKVWPAAIIFITPAWQVCTGYLPLQGKIKHDYVILTYISYKQISFVLLIGCFHCPCHAVHLDSHWLKEGKPVQPIYSNVSGKFDEPQWLLFHYSPPIHTVNRSCGLVLECPPCNQETGVRFPVESDQSLLKVGPDASLLGTQHEGLDWGKFPCDVLVSCPGGVRVLSYIKSPHAKETGEMLLPYGPAWLKKHRSLKD